jgi:hypothetical protein
MGQEVLKDKIKHINTEQICSVHIDLKPKIFGLEWRDEGKFLGIRYRKAGVYGMLGDFYSPNIESRYSDPIVHVKTADGGTHWYEFESAEDAEEFHQFILNIISR